MHQSATLSGARPLVSWWGGRMKFSREDDIGKDIIDTLGHELFSASDYYRTFKDCIKLLKTHNDRFLEVRAYLAYSNMLRSLFEYYVGIFKLNSGDTKNINADILDQRMWRTARNLVNFYRPIEQFTTPNYPKSVPDEFGRDFRVIRNRISHADFRRMQNSDRRNEISLSEFYLKYDFFINKMIYHPQFSWDGENYAGYSWEPVHEFSETLRSKA